MATEEESSLEGKARSEDTRDVKEKEVKVLIKPAGAGKPALGPGEFSYRADWGNRHGQSILTLNWGVINCNSHVFVSASEFSGGDQCDFVGAARYTVHNVSPFNGGVTVWLEIEWNSDIRVHLDYLVIN